MAPITDAAAASNGTMLAVVWNGTPYEMDVVRKPIPTIINGTDAIIKMSSSCLCGSDLHVYHGVRKFGNIHKSFNWLT